MIYLASKSPRRTELLSQIGANHLVIDVSVDEIINPMVNAKENAELLSIQKCQEGIKHIMVNQMDELPVLAADTMVVMGEKIFGKPESEEHAIEMLLELSDKVHTVITGVTVGIISGDKAEFHSITVGSQVEFSNLSLLECKKYCASKEPFDKAGAYGIQGYGSAFVKEIKGSYSNIVGLPIHEVAELFKKLNIPFWLN
ncbi:Maf family protein [Gammaproteobacteria bacterium]|nr:Maf family protein [Gammaproteobacteria bacterium]